MIYWSVSCRVYFPIFLICTGTGASLLVLIRRTGPKVTPLSNVVNGIITDLCIFRTKSWRTDCNSYLLHPSVQEENLNDVVLTSRLQPSWKWGSDFWSTSIFRSIIAALRGCVLGQALSFTEKKIKWREVRGMGGVRWDAMLTEWCSRSKWVCLAEPCWGPRKGFGTWLCCKYLPFQSRIQILIGMHPRRVGIFWGLGYQLVKRV